jgi:hypothetical protein
MKQLQLWRLREEVSSPIQIEERARQEIAALMAEAIIAIIQEEKEERDERVEES